VLFLSLDLRIKREAIFLALIRGVKHEAMLPFFPEIGTSLGIPPLGDISTALFDRNPEA
jgi:hypothetical protein